MATTNQFQNYFFEVYNFKSKSYVLFDTPKIGVNSTAKKHYQNAEIAISKMNKVITKDVVNNLHLIKQRFIQIINSSLVTNGDLIIIEQHKNNLERLKNLIRMVDWNTIKQSEIEILKPQTKHLKLQTLIIGKMKVTGILDRLSNK